MPWLVIHLPQLVPLVIGIAFSAFFSWFFTRRYYHKSLKEQTAAASNQVAGMLAIAEQVKGSSRELLKQKRIEEAIEEYRRAGTPVRVIDSYSDLSDEEKAQLFDTVILRVKGRKPKSNKYRT